MHFNFCKKKGAGLFLVIIFYALNGCQSYEVGKLKSEFQSKKYFQTVNGTHYDVTVQYVPPLFRVINDLGLNSEEKITKAKLESVPRDELLGQGLNFYLHIEPHSSVNSDFLKGDLIFGNSDGIGDYREASNEFLFGLKEKIWLEVNGKKVPIGSYQMENSFGLSKGRTFILIFPSLKSITGSSKGNVAFVMDNIVSGLTRKKMNWDFPVGKHDESI